MYSDVDNDDAQSDGEDWSRPVDEVGTVVPPSICSKRNTQCESMLMSKLGHQRTIIHIDIDCFYAQVEMIRNPHLRKKPLGIQQKYIIVTCNYVARARGLTKLMSIKDAREKCPDLVLVNGEDLTHYREMSYKISEFLQKYTAKVERLGFDENYLDVSDMVEQRLSLNDYTHQTTGFVYDSETETPVPECSCGCRIRLAVGSQIAADIREALHLELGITCCAGIAHNKLLAKLVAGTHKPNQQTTLFPDSVFTLLSSLSQARSLPGVGGNTSRKLAEAGIHSVRDLQEGDISTLTEECGTTMAVTIKQLSHGVDDSPVVQYSRPQTISDEDSFRKCSTIVQTQQKIDELLSSLLKRLVEDGRTPHTFRLTVRRAGFPKYTNRESKQCPVPAHVFQKVGKGDVSFAHEYLRKTAMSLFERIINVKQPFHLTLINVAFAKLEQKPKTGISSFFQLSGGHDGIAGQILSQTDQVENLASGPVTNKVSEHSSDEGCRLSTDVCHLNDEAGQAGDSSDIAIISNSDTSVSLNHSAQHKSVLEKNSLSSHVKPHKDKIGFFEKKVTSNHQEVYKALDQLPLNTSESNERPGLVSKTQTIKQLKELNSTSSSEEETLCGKADVHRGEISPILSTTAFCQDHGLSKSAVDQSVGVTAPLPAGIDAEVFHQLPPDMQEDILANCRSTRSGRHTSDHSTRQQRGRTQLKRKPQNWSSGPVSLPVSGEARDECSNGLKTPEKGKLGDVGGVNFADDVSPFKKKKRLFSPRKSWDTALTPLSSSDDKNYMFTDSQKSKCKSDVAAADMETGNDLHDQDVKGKESEVNILPESASVSLPQFDMFDYESNVDTSQVAGDFLISNTQNSPQFIESTKSKVHVNSMSGTKPKYLSAASPSTQPLPTTTLGAAIKSVTATQSAPSSTATPSTQFVSATLQNITPAAESTSPSSAISGPSPGTSNAEGDARTSEPIFKLMTGPAPPVPPNTDPEVFRSLPIEIQAELALQWEFENMKSTSSHVGKIRQSKKKSPKVSKSTPPKSTTLFNFFRTANKK
ncbi:DNA polymerase iota-like isoform X2 [Haliotis rubra]|uniref:DNA polymerase iota-like isoform X2 n=1 Tax=Haliotis rubra TaxID=36100 RepID=UPI001EE54952|nr:DNA polymerase iota-like isoform X2 [Haliotis rubra]